MPDANPVERLWQLSAGYVARSAARRLLLIEAILPDSLVMLTIGGRQRTLTEYTALLGQCGFSMVREIPTPAGVSIIEAVPV